MQEEYLEMRGKELLIDGIVIAEVTNLEDAMAISDRVSNYVAELQRKNDELLNKLRLANAELNNRNETESLSPYSHEGMMFCVTSGLPVSDCTCKDCCPDCDDQWVAPYDVE